MRVSYQALRGLIGCALAIGGVCASAGGQEKPRGMWPDDERAFPADCGLIDVKTRYGAKGDGVTDDTDALQRAISENVQADRVGRMLYLPVGTYLVSRRLEWRQKPSAQFPAGRWSCLLGVQGESRTRTIIKLRDVCPGFDDPGHARGVLKTANNGSEYGAEAYRNHIWNLTVDTGRGNPGAIGIDYLATNSSSLRDVTVRSGDGGGVYGIYSDGAPALIKNVLVEGFDYGVHSRHATPLENVTVRHQRVAGWQPYDTGSALHFTSENRVCAIKLMTQGQMQARQLLVVLVDAHLNGGAGDQPAIEKTQAGVDGGALYLRDVHAQGYRALVAETGAAGKVIVPGLNAAEYATYPPQHLFPLAGAPVRPLSGGTAHNLPGGTAHNLPGGTAHNLPGGTAHNLPGGTAHNLPGGTAHNLPGGTAHNLPGGTAHKTEATGAVSAVPPSPYLPIAAQPTYHDNDLRHWANVLAYGAQNDRITDRDDAPAIQRAIDSGKSTIYFPTGEYILKSTLHIRGRVRRLVGMGSEINLGRGGSFENAAHPQPVFRVEGTDAPVVFFEHFYSSGIGTDTAGAIWMEHASPRALALRDVQWSFGSDHAASFRNTPGCGPLYLEMVAADRWRFDYPQNVWWRMCNPESHVVYTDKILVRGGSLWILGVQAEQNTTFLRATSGSRCEILAANLFEHGIPGQGLPARPAIVLDDARLLFVGSIDRWGEYDWAQRKYITAIEETQGDVTRTLPRDTEPRRVPFGGVLLNLYRSEPVMTASGLRGKLSAPAVSVNTLPTANVPAVPSRP